MYCVIIIIMPFNSSNTARSDLMSIHIKLPRHWSMVKCIGRELYQYNIIISTTYY